MEKIWILLLPLIVIWLVLIIVALVSCLKAERTNGPKWMWIIIIICVNIIGPILYFVIGRRER